MDNVRWLITLLFYGVYIQLNHWIILLFITTSKLSSISFWCGATSRVLIIRPNPFWNTLRGNHCVKNASGESFYIARIHLHFRYLSTSNSNLQPILFHVGFSGYIASDVVGGPLSLFSTDHILAFHCLSSRMLWKSKHSSWGVVWQVSF